MGDAGYSEVEAEEIKSEVDHYEKVRQEVKLASGDYVDLKMFEPAMRHLLDTYIRAEESEPLSQFNDLTLVQLIVERGEGALDSLPENLRRDNEAMAETIENNIRRLIIDEMSVNPKYYEKMSQLLDALIKQRKQEALNYKAYLARVVELSKQVSQPETQSSYPTGINNGALRALYDNLEDADGAVMEVREPQPHYGSGPALDDRAARAIALDRTIRAVKKADWRGNKFKEKEVRNAIVSELGDSDAVDKIFEIVKNQREY